MLEANYKNSALSLLQRELQKVIYNQLQTKSKQQKKHQSKEQERLDRLKSQLNQIKQQIDFFQQETRRALECVKDSNWHFTKEVCQELSKLKNPNQNMIDVAEKFMIMLDQNDCSWKTFKAVTRNFRPLKSLMNSIQPELLSEEQLKQMMEIWKRQSLLIPQLDKISKGQRLIAQWICYSVEYKLKSDTLHSFKRRNHDLERKIKGQTQKITERSAEIDKIEQKIEQINYNIKNIEVQEPDEETSSFDLSQLSQKSVSIFTKPINRGIDATPIRYGTASGGLMQLHKQSVLNLSTPRFIEREPDFPDFELNDLYGEQPKGLSEFQIEIEDEKTPIGCCRSKFFCY